MEHISATALQRNLSDYRNKAKQGPIIIEEHGTPTVAMIPYSLFTELLDLRDKMQGIQPAALERHYLYEALQRTTYLGDGASKKVAFEVYQAIERLFSVKPLDRDCFEVGGYFFGLDDTGRLASIDTSKWFSKDETKGNLKLLRSNLSDTLMLKVSLEGFQERPWEGSPSPALLKHLKFIPALMGVGVQQEAMAKWMGTLAALQVTWERDEVSIEAALREASKKVLERNKYVLSTYFGHLDLDEVKTSFGLS